MIVVEEELAAWSLWAWNAADLTAISAPGQEAFEILTGQAETAVMACVMADAPIDDDPPNMVSDLSPSYAKRLCAGYDKLTCMTITWHDARMATGTLVALIRAHKTAEQRRALARRDLDHEIARVIDSGEWQIIDVAEVTGWSRETIRAIVKRVHENPEGFAPDDDAELADPQ